MFFIFLFICLAGHFDCVFGAYFSLHLKNKNCINTEKYWQDGQTIFFFAQNGTVGLPSALIDHIAAATGDLTTGTIYYPDDAFDKELLSAEVQPKNAYANKDEIMSDLQDRIAVLETNIASLTKNLETYNNQRAKYNNDKEKAHNRLARLETDSYLTSTDRQERASLEESKVMDIDNNLKHVDSQIQNTENMLESQKRMKMRLENELAKHNASSKQ